MVRPALGTLLRGYVLGNSGTADDLCMPLGGILGGISSVVYPRGYISGDASDTRRDGRSFSAMRRDGRFGCRTMDEHCWQRVAAAEG